MEPHLIGKLRAVNGFGAKSAVSFLRKIEVVTNYVLAEKSAILRPMKNEVPEARGRRSEERYV
jgi:hypothetical protein